MLYNINVAGVKYFFNLSCHMGVIRIRLDQLCVDCMPRMIVGLAKYRSKT